MGNVDVYTESELLEVKVSLDFLARWVSRYAGRDVICFFLAQSYHHASTKPCTHALSA
jgi:hypothetical protein